MPRPGGEREQIYGCRVGKVSGVGEEDAEVERLGRRRLIGRGLR